MERLYDKDCPFCGAEVKYDKSLAPNTRELFQTENFVARVDLAPLNKTHLTVCPKNHILSFADMPEEYLKEAKEIIESINEYNKPQGKTEWFEHGTSSCSASGACVSHAHIHGIVPEIENAFEKAIKYLSIFNNKEIDFDEIEFFELSKIKKDNGYLLHIDKDKKAHHISPDIYPSQFWRIIYANGKQWNWKLMLNQNKVKELKEFEQCALKHYAGVTPAPQKGAPPLEPRSSFY
jgi:diadenosine tetraphosphate (Ap4A) HIT family hydrolase